MDAEVKQRWVAALRSGEYLQSTNYLRSDGGYCCLGVLCDVEDVIEWDGPVKDGDRKFSSEDYDTMLPTEYLGYFGLADPPTDSLLAAARQLLDDDTAVEEPDSVATLLAGMNDEGLDFWQIADFIEAHL